MKNTIKAVIWDYDGTLVDSLKKNWNVTKKIVNTILGTEAEKYHALQSLQSYQSSVKNIKNWRDYYKKEFNLSELEIDNAGKLWTGYQLEDSTPSHFYDGIKEVIRTFKDYPQGIVSQNSKSNIIQNLRENGLSSYFGAVIGYEEVDIRKQKPKPDGLLLCIRKLSALNSGYVFYIGDQESDVQCSFNANARLSRNKTDVRIVSICASYTSNNDSSNWYMKPDIVAQQTTNLVTIVQEFERSISNVK